jgi:hypothetical protein
MAFVPVEYHEEWRQSVLSHHMVLRCTLMHLYRDWSIGCVEHVAPRDFRNPRLVHYVTRKCRYMIFERGCQIPHS